VCSYLVTNGTAKYKVIDVPENDQYALNNQSDCDPKVNDTLVHYVRVTSRSTLDCKMLV